MFTGWQKTWLSFWPCSWLKRLRNSCNVSWLIRQKAPWMPAMRPFLTSNFGYKPYTRSYCMLPAATGPFVGKKKNDQPGLVKVLCLSFDRKARLDHEKKKSSGTSYETMLGSSSWAHALFVCFPAAWMPLVVEALRQRTVTRLQGVMQQGAVARTASSSTVVPNNRELSFRLKRWHVDRRGQGGRVLSSMREQC